MTQQDDDHQAPSTRREGEIALGFDPATRAADASLVFIGRVGSPWTTRDECPRNMAAATELGGGATISLHPEYRSGLEALEGTSHLILLSWLDRSRRDLIVQQPRHAPAPRGTFALRSPVRPNPIGVHVVRLVGMDAGRGLLSLDAIDLLDGTPVLDIKPYYATTDAVPDAVTVR